MTWHHRIRALNILHSSVPNVTALVDHKTSWLSVMLHNFTCKPHVERYNYIFHSFELLTFTKKELPSPAKSHCLAEEKRNPKCLWKRSHAKGTMTNDMTNSLNKPEGFIMLYHYLPVAITARDLQTSNLELWIFELTNVSATSNLLCEGQLSVWPQICFTRIQQNIQWVSHPLSTAT